MSLDECEQLAALAGNVPAHQAIVEIGFYRGLSSAWLAAGSRGARVTCVDFWPQPNPRDHDMRRRNGQAGALAAFLELQEELGWPVTPLRARAVDAAAMWMQPVGLLFHDASHDYRSVNEDLAAWLPRLTSDAVIALHDYTDEHGHRTDVAQVVDDLLGEWNHSQIVDKLWIGWR
jgi:predicted O-methyltransferase YrrM